jgi:hypothetical protein
MKKTVFYIVCLLLLVSCGDKKDEAKKDETTTVKDAQNPVVAPQDAAFIEWLSGKKLVSTSKDPKFDTWHDLKMNADGSCQDKDNATAKWTVKDGKFVFESVMVITKDMEKRDDTTVVFKGAIGDQAYILKPIN